MGIFRELYIHPCSDDNHDGFPDELMITNGKHTMVYIPYRVDPDKGKCIDTDGDIVHAFECPDCGHRFDTIMGMRPNEFRDMMWEYWRRKIREER